MVKHAFSVKPAVRKTCINFQLNSSASCFKRSHHEMKSECLSVVGKSLAAHWDKIIIISLICCWAWSVVVYRGSPTSAVSTSTISTSTNFQKVLHKVVLVGDLISKFILVELTLCTVQLVRILHSTVQKIVLSGDPLYSVLTNMLKYKYGSCLQKMISIQETEPISKNS